MHVGRAAIEGSVPLGLRGGRLLVNGPGWTVIGGRVAHPCDGHGYLRAFAFQADGSEGVRPPSPLCVVRWVQSPRQRRALGQRPGGP
ncbi:MAG: hypothetical protein EXR71_20660 [Myxococcales bacterium]|nr:hypothetical protein [Myxococcales bacterium]